MRPAEFPEDIQPFLLPGPGEEKGLNVVREFRGSHLISKIFPWTEVFILGLNCEIGTKREKSSYLRGK